MFLLATCAMNASQFPVPQALDIKGEAERR
jgi:hypothetical protein